MADAPGKSDTPAKEKKPSLWQRFKEYAKNNPIRTAIMAILITAAVVVASVITAGIATGAFTIAGGISLAAGAAGFAWDSANRLNKGAKKVAAIEDKPAALDAPVKDDLDVATNNAKRVASSSTVQIASAIEMTNKTRISNKPAAVSENKPIQPMSHEKGAVVEMVERFAKKYGGADDSGLFKERRNFAENYLKLDMLGSDKKASVSGLQKQMLSAMNNYEKAYQKKDAKELVLASTKLNRLYEKVDEKVEKIEAKQRMAP